MEESIHKDKMKRICKEILNVCWCHSCGGRKGLTYYYASYCSKWCWKALERNIDENYIDYKDWCILGENCLNCVDAEIYTLAHPYHIQRYYNIDPM